MFAFMVVDLPEPERAALGLDEELIGRLRVAVHRHGPEAAAPLVPDRVLRRYAIAGERDEVIDRLSAAVAAVRPELVAFHAHTYDAEFVADVAELAAQAGIGGRTPAPSGRV